MKTAWLLPLTLLLLIPAASPAAERARPCTPARAETATIAAIAGDPERWMGHCVTVTGAVADGMLIADSDAYYRHPKEIGDPSSNGGVLGLDGKHPADWRMAQVTGRVQDCETTRDLVQGMAEPGEIVMTAGYCHTADGAYLWVVAHRDRGPVKLRRALVSRPGFGDLQPAPADWPHRAMAEEFRRRFLTALRSGDAAALTTLHTPGDYSPEDGRQAARGILGARSIFAEVRQADGPQSVFLVYRALDPEETDNEEYRASICFCREADCTGRWPIDKRDTLGLASHPYACTELTPWILSPKKGRVPVLITEWTDGGLAEAPRR